MSVTSGTLWKRRGGLGKHMPGAWQRRWFTLDSDTGLLTYYDQDHAPTQEETPRNTLNLKEEPCAYLRSPVDGAPTEHCLTIVPNDHDREKWRLCGSDTTEMSKWRSAVKPFDKGRKSTRRDSLMPGSVQGATVTSGREGGSMGGSSILEGDEDTDEDTPGTVEGRPKILSSPMPAPKPEPRSQVEPVVVPAVNSPRSVVKRTPRKSMSRRRGRFSAKTAGDSYEALLVLILMNACFMFGTVELVDPEYVQVLSTIGINIPVIAPTLSFVSVRYVLYVVLANFVVGRTLYLRANREVVAQSEEASALDASGGASPSGRRRLPSEASTVQTDTAEVEVKPAAAVADNGKCPIGVTFNESESLAPNCPDHSWSRCDHRHFKVRQKGYKQHGKKDSSAAPIYEVFAMDCFETERRKDHISRFMDLPDVKEMRAKLASGPGLAKYVPPLFVFQLQLPVEAPSLWGSKKEDGPGWAMCVFFKLSDASLQALLAGDSGGDDAVFPSGLRCFARWCQNYSTNMEWKKRVKLIASCLNLDEMGVSGFVQGFNAKPVLIRRTSTIFRDEELTYLELDIHVQKFDAMAQQSIVSMTSRAGEMYMEIGILIESRDEDELPELLVGCVGCNKPKDSELQQLGVGDDEFE